MVRFQCLFVLLVAVCAMGCGLLGSAAERQASLTISNYSNWAVCSVQVASHQQAPDRRAAATASFDEALDAPQWSDNLLEEDEIIGPGYMRTLPVQAGRWDIRMADCRDRPLYARRGVVVTGAVQLDFRPIRVERPEFFSRRRVASDDDRAPTRF